MLHSVWQIECIGKKEKRMLVLDYRLLQFFWQVIIIPKIKATLMGMENKVQIQELYFEQLDDLMPKI